MEKTPPFSYKRMKEIAIEIKIRRAMTMAKQATPNTDFKIRHPDWVRDAQNNNYINLKKVVREEIEKKQQIALDRRAKIAGK